MRADPPPQVTFWNAEGLRRQLSPLLPGVVVVVQARAGSTNSVLIERARAAAGPRSDDAAPCLLVAEVQTAGRGRLGRAWQSEGPSSLTFSLALQLAPADWSGLSLAVGLALAETLDPPAPGTRQPPRIALKWPNDLWLAEGPGRGRKLGGVLLETVSVGERRVCVVGVGLNVWPLQAGALQGGHACLREVAPSAEAPQVLARLAGPLARALLRFQSDGFAPLVAAYAQRDLLLWQPVRTEGRGAAAGQPLHGVAEGVDARGALRIRSGDGTLHTVVSGEVSVRPLANDHAADGPAAPC